MPDDPTQLRRLDDRRYEQVLKELRAVSSHLSDLGTAIEAHVDARGHPVTLAELDSLRKQFEALLDALAPLIEGGTIKAIAAMARHYEANTQVAVATSVFLHHYFGWLHIFKRPGTWIAMTFGGALLAATAWALVRLIHPG